MESEPSGKIFIIDGHSYSYQAYYGIPRLSTPSGLPVGAVFGFAQLLEKVRGEHPTHAAVVFDTPEPTFRHLSFPQYKANRAPAPEEFVEQMPRIRELIQAYSIPILELPGYEADDVIATVAKRASGAGFECLIVSKDKDLDQLLDDRTRIYDPRDGRLSGMPELLEKKGLRPDQVVDYLSLVGDPTDNVPGLPGVGPKTALKVLAEVDSLDEFLQGRRQANGLPPKLIDRLLSGKEAIERSRDLVTVRTDCPIAAGLEDLRLREPDWSRLRDLFERYHFHSLLRRLAAAPGAGANAEADGPSWAPPGPAERIPEGDRGPAPQDGEKAGEGDREPEGDGDEGGGAPVPAAPAAESQPAAQSLPSTYRTVRSRSDLEALSRRLRECGRFAFDTETTGLSPFADRLVGLSFAVFDGPGSGPADPPRGQEAISAPVSAYYVPIRAPEPLELAGEEVLSILRPVLEDPAIEKLGQNLKFDARFCRAGGIRLRGIAGDSMIASYLLNPGVRGHNLDSLALEYLHHRNIPIESLIGGSGELATMDQVPLEAIGRYACEDADAALRLAAVLEEKLDEDGLLPLYRDVEVPLIDVLCEMEHAGIALDREHLREMGRKLQGTLEDLTRRIHEQAGREFNIASPQQLGKVLFEELGLPRGRRGKTGYSTASDVLENLADKHPVVPMILEHRSLTKLLGTYVEALPRLVEPTTGRIHTTFNQTVAATGRLSSTDPNLQNIPVKTDIGREIRRAFIAGSPDRLLISADYSQVELRILAHLSADGSLVKSFLAEEDIHRSVAAIVNGVPPGEVTSSMRRAAKAVNFGIIYGMSAYGLSRDLGIPVEDAAAFIQRYFETYPGVRDFIERTLEGARRSGEVRTILGRRRRIPDLDSRNQRLRGIAERTAVNTAVQGSAADLIKVAMNNIHTDIEERGADCRLLLQIHDELVFEVPRSAAAQESERIRTEMAGAIELSVPIAVHIEIGESWYEA